LQELERRNGNFISAPRKYSNAQRAAMYRLYEAGMQPSEIVRACHEGTASVEPFEIPRRSCHDIVVRIARESRQETPQTIAEAGSGRRGEGHASATLRQ
jgi:hypothetical protein